MKTAQQIIGLPVVSVFDGNEIGKVKNVIINASKGTIDFFVIDSGIRSLAGGVIPADRVLGIGEYALTIQQPDDISDIVKIPAAIELMQKNITVRGTRVLTKKGMLLGETGDIFINDEDAAYNITGVEFVPADSTIKSGIIPRSSIITFGKDLLVVHDDFIDKLIETPSAIRDEKKNMNLIDESSMDSSGEEGEETGTVGSDENITEDTADLYKIDGFTPGDNIDIAFENPDEKQEQDAEQEYNILGEVPAVDADEQSLSPAELFEHRQRQYLIGKKVTKEIYDSSGEIIVNAGDIITKEIINEVKAKGKLIELVMNYEE